MWAEEHVGAQACQAPLAPSFGPALPPLPREQGGSHFAGRGCGSSPREVHRRLHCRYPEPQGFSQQTRLSCLKVVTVIMSLSLTFVLSERGFFGSFHSNKTSTPSPVFIHFYNLYYYYCFYSWETVKEKSYYREKNAVFYFPL